MIVFWFSWVRSVSACRPLGEGKDALHRSDRTRGGNQARRGDVQVGSAPVFSCHAEVQKVRTSRTVVDVEFTYWGREVLGGLSRRTFTMPSSTRRFLACAPSVRPESSSCDLPRPSTVNNSAGRPASIR